MLQNGCKYVKCIQVCMMYAHKQKVNILSLEYTEALNDGKDQ